jgi:hypothetical protein
MEPSPAKCWNRTELADRIANFEQCCRPQRSHGDSSNDQDHKMILLLEYLCRSGLHQVTTATRRPALRDLQP